MTASFAKFAPYLAAQLLGGIVGAASGLAALFAALEGNAGRCRKAGVFLHRAGDPQCRSEFIQRNHRARLCLSSLLARFFQRASRRRVQPRDLGPYLVGSLVWGIGLSLGGTTGYAINPARDLGPRIAHAILPIAGKGGSDWGYAPIPVIGPLVGGALAGLLLRILAVF